jgi:predicted proteasome-type protease
MTICVSVKVSEGLVLAADSAAAVQGVMTVGDQQLQGLLKTFDYARKCHISRTIR